jgi:exodeoxyribonuclease V beta subunit
MHTIMENLPFDAERETIIETVVAGLRQYGFDEEWSAVLTDTIQRVLDTPLDQSGMKLSDVPESQRLIEMEFTYPVARLQTESFEALLRKHGHEAVLRKQSATEGYLKGFIDLIFSHENRFYIADYKSNWLGEGEGDYAADRLPAVIQRESYNLQYLLYTTALNRYLKLRLPDYDYDTHFGGVFYLFMRGMNPSLGSGFGVFADRPDSSLVNDMDEYFRGEA